MPRQGRRGFLGAFLRTVRLRYFATPTDTAVTLAISAVLALAIPPLARWAIFDARWFGTSRADCEGGGACWVFVKVHFGQFLFGFYPAAERWRVATAGGLALLLFSGGLTMGLAPTHRVSRILRAAGPMSNSVAIGLAITAIVVLLSGGMPGLPVVETSLWGGLMLTLVVATVGCTASLPIGIVLALARRSRLAVPRFLAIAFVETWRGVPLITVLFMASVMIPLFLPPAWRTEKLTRCLIGVTFFAAAYMSEAVRGGLQGVERGQTEAAHALGMTRWQVLRLIVLPQALRIALPGMVNVFIGMFKDTTLVLVIGLFDLLGIVQAAATNPEWLGYSLEGYVFAGAVFWCGCFFMSRLSQRVEGRFRVEK